MIKYNSDKLVVSKVKAALKKNDGYCPCSLVKNEDTKCMCKQFREQKTGVCHCGLFTKNND